MFKKNQMKPKYQLINPKQAERIVVALSSSDITVRMANIFKILSDPSRLKIVIALQEGELCVNDLASATEFSQSSVSHHLKSLRDLNLVRFRREGKLTFYALAGNHVSALLAVAHDHAREVTS